MTFSTRAALAFVTLTLAVTPLVSQQGPPQQTLPPTPATRDVASAGAPAGPAAPARPPLPPLSPDAKNLFDQLQQTQSSIIEQLRFLQLAYRDAGRAEDAAVIAAHVRQLQQQRPPLSGAVSAELVHEGLPTRDEPIRMMMFRHHVGKALTFAIRGRDDQPLWGTTSYSDDSGLETAAVHAGLMRPGQIGIVKVAVLPGQEKYIGSVQNGVRSTEFSRSEGSYRFMAVSLTTPIRTSSLASYRDLVGHAITLPMVGTATGTVRGSDVYTDNSAVAAAAVHAGVLSVGEFGFIKVILMPGQPRYEGSSRNGVTSQSSDIWEGSYRLEPASQPWIVQLPGGEDASRLVPMSTFRGKQDINFVVQVKGTASGTVWGSGIYTDDSSVAVAAVHAGLLKVDEIGFVRVILARGLQEYRPTEANGIKTEPYGPWEGSFRLERVVR